MINSITGGASSCHSWVLTLSVVIGIILFIIVLLELHHILTYIGSAILGVLVGFVGSLMAGWLFSVFCK